MQETNLPYDQQQEVESHDRMYIRVWVALLVLTILEYVYASFAHVSFLFLVLGLMVMAFIKAGLVAAYFMHLKFEGNWVYLMLVPAGVLVLVLILALYPDIGMQRTVWPDYRTQEEEAAVIPPPAGAAGQAPKIVPRA